VAFFFGATLCCSHEEQQLQRNLFYFWQWTVIVCLYCDFVNAVSLTFGITFKFYPSGFVSSDVVSQSVRFVGNSVDGAGVPHQCLIIWFTYICQNPLRLIQFGSVPKFITHFSRPKQSRQHRPVVLLERVCFL